MNNFFGDILQPLPDEQLLNYLKICELNLPLALRAHHFLRFRWKILLKQVENDEIFRKITPKCKNSIYVPKHNDLKNCTFISLTDDARGSDYCIFAFTLEKSCDELMECFRYSKRIKWELGPLVESLEEEHVESFKIVLEEKGLQLETESCEKCWCLRLAKHKAKNLAYIVPQNVKILPLREDQAEYIHSFWPYEFENSCEYIRSMILLNGGLGVCEQNSDELLCWIITNDNLAPGCLQTIDRAKRQGLAKLLLQVWCKQFAEEENIDIVCFIECSNDISLRLFQSIGFEVYKACNWLRIKTAQ